MARVDELLDELGTAKFCAMLYLTKGYWHIALSAEFKGKNKQKQPSPLCMVCTNSSHFCSACSKPQPLSSPPWTGWGGLTLLPPTYLDVIIHSSTWAEHVQQVVAVLETLRQAGLRANPKKCPFGWREVQYLGYHLGSGQARTQMEKTTAIVSSPRPKT